MRCLYCGKELALFKRLRGGEFCSDAHRQHYQEEYTQLALNRLLQANSSGEPEPAKAQNAKASDIKVDTKGPDTRTPDTRPSDIRPMETPALKRRERLTREEAPTPAVARESFTNAQPQTFAPPAHVVNVASAENLQQTAVLDPEPNAAAAPAPEERPPAELAGLFLEVPVPALAEIPALAKAETGLLPSVAPSLPRLQEFRLDPNGVVLSEAGPIPQRHSAPTDSSAAPRERGLEVREFVRSLPSVEIRLAPASEVGFANSQQDDSQETDSQQMMEVEVDPHPPQESPELWQESPREFPVPEAVFVESARLDFETTGWGDAKEGAPSVGKVPRAEAPRVEAPKVEIPKPGFPAIRVSTATDPARPMPVSTGPVFTNPVFTNLVSPSARVSLDPIRLAGLTASVNERAAAGDEPQERPQPVSSLAPAPAPGLIPDAVTKPLPLTLHGLAPARGKATQVFSSALAWKSEIQAPRQSALPLRPVMVLGPTPQVEAEAKISAEKQVRPASVPNVKPRKSEVRVLSPQTREEGKKGEAKPEFKLEIKRVPAQPKAEAPKPEPMQLVKPSGAPVPSPAMAAKEPLEPARPAAKESKLAPVAQSKPGLEAGTGPASSVVPSASSPAASLKEAKLKPKAPEPVEGFTPSAPSLPEPDLLGLPKLSLEAEGSFWSKLPALARIGVAAGMLAAIAGGIFLTSRGSSATRSAARGSEEPPMVEAGPPIGSDAGWAADWFTDGPGVRQARHVDVLKGSLMLRDYRMEFEGQIEQQAIGWVFRANNKANFYVEKVAIVTPGLEPTVALIRFAVIGGKEQPRVQVPLPIKVHLDTLYKIRTDVVGQRFSTWVQDQKVDEWTDSRIEAGGAGLYYDSGDSAKLKGTVTLTPLKAR
jgi:hypothetical protein